MSNIDVSKILVAIARLEEKYDSLDEDMKGVMTKLEDCMKTTAECNQKCLEKNFKYMITTVLAAVIGIFGWALFLRGVI